MSNYEDTRTAFNRRVNTQINPRMDGSGPTELAWEAWKAALAWRDSGAPEPPSKEAVEAAIACACVNHMVDLLPENVEIILSARMRGDCTKGQFGFALTAARILAAEVEQARAEVDTLSEALKQSEAMLAEWVSNAERSGGRGA